MGEPYEWLTFKQAALLIERFSNSISNMQLCRDIEIKDSGISKIHWRLMGIYSENRAEYVIA
jgi:hypothetical protein